jgi:hypothetical protein
MTCKLTYRYRDVTSSTDDGWSEEFYVGSGDAAAALAIAVAPGWLNERLAWLASTYMLSSITAQNIANRFDNARRRFTNATGVGQYPVGGRAQAEGEAPWTGVLVRLLCGTTTQASKTLRGIASDVIGNNLEYTPPARFRTAFETWLEDLAEAPNAYQLRHQVLGAPLLNPTSITVLADRRSIQLVYPAGTAPGTLPPRTIIELKGVQGATPVNGLWRVQNNDSTIVTLFPRRKNIYGVPSAPATVKILTYTYPAITDGEVIRGGSRKAGRPSDALRGRARTRQS